MTHDDSSQVAVELFYSMLKKKNMAEREREYNDDKIIQYKNKEIIPIKKFLKTLIDNGVYVHSHTKFSVGEIEIDHKAKKLTVYEDRSSPHWEPGYSLYLEDPAQLEITVTNPSQKNKEGLIVFAVRSEHPDSHLLTGPFSDASQACIALAKFLSINTVFVKGSGKLK